MKNKRRVFLHLILTALALFVAYKNGIAWLLLLLPVFISWTATGRETISETRKSMPGWKKLLLCCGAALVIVLVLAFVFRVK